MRSVGQNDDDADATADRAARLTAVDGAKASAMPRHAPATTRLLIIFSTLCQENCLRGAVKESVPESSLDESTPMSDASPHSFIAGTKVQIKSSALLRGKTVPSPVYPFSGFPISDIFISPSEQKHRTVRSPGLRLGWTLICYPIIFLVDHGSWRCGSGYRCGAKGGHPGQAQGHCPLPRSDCIWPRRMGRHRA